MLKTPGCHASRRSFLTAAAVFAATATFATAPAWSAGDGPDALIQRLSDQVLAAVKANQNALQSGNLTAIMKIIDDLIMPNVDFVRMTASAVGPGWRRATPEQKEKLQSAFKTLLIRTYSGAIKQVGDQTVELRPFRGNATDQEAVVRTLVHGKGDPIQLDYRLERTSGGWKIYDLNVLGVWLVDNYRPQFAQQINNGGIDALIQALDTRNSANAAQ